GRRRTLRPDGARPPHARAAASWRAAPPDRESRRSWQRQAEPLADDRADPPLDLGDRGRGIDDGAALRRGRGDGVEAVAQAAMECDVHPLIAILATGPAGGAGQPGL